MTRTIDVAAVQRLRSEGVPIVDVLPAEHYAQQHIPGAVNVPLDESGFEERVRAVAPDRSAPLVVYCLDPDCQASPAAAHVLADHLGYEDVRLFEGGLLAWRRAGHRYDGRGPKRVRLEDLHEQ